MVILESQLILKDECFYVNTREPTICFAFSRYVLLVLSWYLTFHYVVCSSLRYNYLGIKNTLFHVHTNFSFIFIFSLRKERLYVAFYGNWKRLVILFLFCKEGNCYVLRFAKFLSRLWIDYYENIYISWTALWISTPLEISKILYTNIGMTLQ